MTISILTETWRVLLMLLPEVKDALLNNVTVNQGQLRDYLIFILKVAQRELSVRIYNWIL